LDDYALRPLRDPALVSKLLLAAGELDEDPQRNTMRAAIALGRDALVELADARAPQALGAGATHLLALALLRVRESARAERLLVAGVASFSDDFWMRYLLVG